MNFLEAVEANKTRRVRQVGSSGWYDRNWFHDHDASKTIYVADVTKGKWEAEPEKYVIERAIHCKVEDMPVRLQKSPRDIIIHEKCGVFVAVDDNGNGIEGGFHKLNLYGKTCRLTIEVLDA